MVEMFTLKNFDNTINKKLSLKISNAKKNF